MTLGLGLECAFTCLMSFGWGLQKLAGVGANGGFNLKVYKSLIQADTVSALSFWSKNKLALSAKVGDRERDRIQTWG